MGFDVIEFLNEVVMGQCHKRGFQLPDPVSERHGSWEWTFHKRLRDLDRFVFVALTSMPGAVTPPQPWYTVELWAGAANETRFTRRLISDFRAVGIGEFADDFSRAIVKPLESAMDVAEAFQPADLIEAYLPSRTQAQGT